MSLINDALKKAQKQRTGESPPLASLPSVGGETPHRIAKRAKPTSINTLIFRGALGAGFALLLVVGSYFAFRAPPVPSAQLPASSPVAQTATVQPTLPATPNPAPSSPLPAQNPQVSAPVSAPATAPVFTLPVAPVPAPSSQIPAPSSQVSVPAPQVPASDPQVSGFRSQVSAPPAPVVPAPTGSDPRVSPFSSPTATTAAANPPVSGLRSQVAEPAKPALKLEPRAIQFIENIKVAGIMARPTDSKVLMNDRVYRIGSLVEAEMGLTLVGITSNTLTFEDGHGGRYTRTF